MNPISLTNSFEPIPKSWPSRLKQYFKSNLICTEYYNKLKVENANIEE